MRITNFYCGWTNRLSGVVYDTERKTYKSFMLKGFQWTTVTEKEIVVKPEFKTPGDIYYQFDTLHSLDDKTNKLIEIGFSEDNSMVLDFGVVVV